MYAQADKTKENKSRTATGSMTQKKGIAKQILDIIDNRNEAMMTRSLRNVGAKTANSTAQPKKYKVFEKDDKSAGKPKKGNTYTTLGVRKEEMEEDGDLIPGELKRGSGKRAKSIPQGMSLLSSSDVAEQSINSASDSYGVYEIEDNSPPATLTIRKDPDKGSHYLLGPTTPMKFDKLHGQVQSTQDDWTHIRKYERKEWVDV